MFTERYAFVVEVGNIDVNHAATKVLREEPNIVHLAAPVNIFGDIHGQFFDLMDMMNRTIPGLMFV